MLTSAATTAAIRIECPRARRLLDHRSHGNATNHRAPLICQLAVIRAAFAPRELGSDQRQDQACALMRLTVQL